jgi:predicted HTH transcriptional regulator
VDKKNFLVLSQEYGKLKKFIQEFSPQIPVKQAKIVKKAEISEENRENSSMKLGLSPLSRQKKIVEMIKSKGEVSLSELRDTFSNVTSRTLRRDLSSLLDKNMIERIRNGKEEVLFTGPKI